MKLLKKGFVFIMSILVTTGMVPALKTAALSNMAPYDKMTSPTDFYNGAMLDLRPTGDAAAWIKSQLQTMKNEYNINTVNIYGLEGFSAKDALFAELKRLNMQVVVRIESYSSSFAFLESDLEWIMNKYRSLLDYVCSADKRAQVAYFSLNMPVDDGNVQRKLEGGINGQQSRQRQVSYATAFVARMRQETANRGFAGAKMFLSIFYGWDNSFQVPSYAPAGADGYFMNNYSYPKNNIVPDETASDENLINRARLSISVAKYRSQYPGKPLVTEFGFHTMEYNGGKRPNQTAGLVANKAAKIRAIKATIAYYKTVPEFRGALYFGYNLYKEEGNPPAVMDWTLRYPDEPAPSVTTPSTASGSATTASAPAAAASTAAGMSGSVTATAPETPHTDDITSATQTASVARTVAAQTDGENGGRTKKGLSAAVQAGIGVAVFLTLTLLGTGGVWLYFKRKKPVL